MLKRFLILCLSLVIVFSLAACNDNTNSADGKDGKEDDTLKIGISLPSATHGWMGALIDSAEKQAKALKESAVINRVLIVFKVFMVLNFKYR